MVKVYERSTKNTEHLLIYRLGVPFHSMASIICMCRSCIWDRFHN